MAETTLAGSVELCSASRWAEARVNGTPSRMAPAAASSASLHQPAAQQEGSHFASTLRLLGTICREEVDNRDWYALVSRYAPASDGNGEELYARQMAHRLTALAHLGSLSLRDKLPEPPHQRGELARSKLEPEGAARLLHPLGSLLGRPPSAALLGTSAPALTLHMASIPPIR